MKNINYINCLLFGVLGGAALYIGACADPQGGAKLQPSPSELRSGNIAGISGGAATPGSVQDFTIHVGDRVFFETDTSDLSAAAQGILDKQVLWLNKYPRYYVTLEGHADERGTREYNFALGARRAEAVKNYLLAQGIPASRMRTISYGKERPVAVCNDISCWSQNRRVVTVLRE